MDESLSFSLRFSFKNTVSCLSFGILVLATACASPGKKTALGAGAGAATGAVIGGATGGWKGAAAGGILGGAIGAGFGNILDKQAQELAQVAETQRTEEGILVQLKNDLLFDTGSATPKEQAVREISKLGYILSKYKNDKIRVEGYTDSTGRKSFNEALSLRRAKTVKNLLTAQGVPANQVIVVGLGPTQPLANNGTPEGRAINRRVELHIEMPESGGRG
jgi:outer membrane protein OmpA-like peptidoglycan-associated protein